MAILLMILSFCVLCIAVSSNHQHAHREKTMRELYRLEYTRLYPTST